MDHSNAGFREGFDGSLFPIQYYETLHKLYIHIIK
jgi:hypothetical protein